MDKLNKDCWSILSRNENAIPLLEKNLDKLGYYDDYDVNNDRNYLYLIEPTWHCLSRNPNAISLLEKYPNKIHWKSLCLNPNANHLFHLLKKNLDKLNNESWSNLSGNPSIFEIDYMKTKKNMVDIFFEELMMIALHPNRIMKWLEVGFEDF